MKLLLILAYLCLPAAIVLHIAAAHLGMEPTATFVLAAIAIIPLARLIGIATEQLAERAGPTLGGLLNATFGNACELIFGFIGVWHGLSDVVKASLTGSIIGNLLLVSGGAMLVGGWKRKKQVFSRESAQTSAGLLAVAVAAMLLPAIFHYSFQQRDRELLLHERNLSIGTSIVLLMVYATGLLFTLKSQQHLFTPEPATSEEHPMGLSAVTAVWTVRKSVLILALASALVAVASELMTGTVEAMAMRMGWSEVFVGVIVIAIVGNAAEHSTAILLAYHNDMQTAMSITFQSSLQIALFVTPALVIFASLFAATGQPNGMNLVFPPVQVAAILLSVAIMVVLGLNGETNWFEGALLLGVYAILAITFFYMPREQISRYDLMHSRQTPDRTIAADKDHATSN